ncbi:ABC transporter permease [Anaeromyxobacter sp. SG64]|uniref:ABC transporter permease n=1 Tax=Anaeromyxobacter sp. SG64 TaxID=2925409 RepID=UPI001F59E964|nr:FtsX-like permease family protein [Anaeromyxobacter sp. SG64]
MRSSPPLLRIAWRNVRRNARHSLGSMLAIAVGFVAISLFDGYMTFLGENSANMFAEMFMLGDLMIEPAGASDVDQGTAGMVLLGERERAFLDGFLADRSGEVEARMRLLYAWGVASAGKASAPFVAFAFDPLEGARLRRRFAWNAVAGRPLQLAPESSVVLGMGLGSLLDCEPAGHAAARRRDGTLIPEERPLACRRPRVQLVASTASGQLNVVEPEVVGLIDGGTTDLDAKLANMPLSLAQKLLDTKGLSMYLLLLRDPSRASAFGRELERAAAAKGLALHAVPWREHTAGVEHMRGMKVLGVFRSLMAFVVVLIAGMTVLTTMAKAVSERTREIGTLRSLGFLRRQIVALFALEAALLAIVASAIGLVATLALAAATNAAGITYNAGLLAQPIALGVRYLPRTWSAAAVFLSTVAAAAAVLPARRAARARIPDALSHT